ncbi:BLUF domain-containing protein [Algibacter sp. Ld11]|uniref:BLUF domain-containing protein n=1 Tax=Algibacter sp. Ld11 TaxID=649150 RepID=UPI003866CE0B
MLKTICYKSQAKTTLNILEFEAILNETQSKNDNNNITGVLVKKDKIFFQIIEGTETVIDKLYQKIQEDTRHSNIIEILNAPISQLSFEAFDAGYTVIENIEALYGLQKYITALDQTNFENGDLFLEIIEELLSSD